jgi:hypothetical protein
MNLIGTYKTKLRCFVFRWPFERLPHGQTRIYIVEAPSNGPRSPDDYQLRAKLDGERRHLEFGDDFFTLDRVISIAEGWADKTADPMINGGTFPTWLCFRHMEANYARLDFQITINFPSTSSNPIPL